MNVAADPAPGLLTALAYLGLAPGDVIELPVATPPPTPVVSTVIAPTVPGAEGYQVTLSCGGAGDGGTATVEVTRYGCGAASDIFIRAADAEGITLATLVRRSVPLTAVIDLSAETPTAPATTQVALTGLPTDLTYADVFLEPLGGAEWRLPGAIFNTTVVPVASLEVTREYAQLDLPRGRLAATVVRDGVGTRVLERRGTIGATNTLAFDQLEVPWLSDASIDLTTRTMTWVGEGPGAFDVVSGQLQNFAPGSSGSEGRVRWNFAARTGAGVDELVLPRLPAAYAAADLTEDPSFILRRLGGARTDLPGDAFTRLSGVPWLDGAAGSVASSVAPI
ncbi:MAG: hypothetical protein R2939_05835 [Kofleriaceae bacterium]